MNNLNFSMLLVILLVVVAIIGLGYWMYSERGTATVSDTELATAKGADGLPIIFTYIEREEKRQVEAWLAAGGDIEIEGFQGATPVLKAAVADNWPMAQFLLEQGADPNAYDRRGMTLPWLAETSRVSAGSSDYEGLLWVRAYLAERNIAQPTYEPNQVKEMIQSGTWPLETNQ